MRRHGRLARAVPAPRPVEEDHRRRRPGRRDALSETRQPHAGNVHSDAVARPRGDSGRAGPGGRAQGLPRLGHGGAGRRFQSDPREHRGARHPQDAPRRHEARPASQEDARRHRGGAAHPAMGRRAKQAEPGRGLRHRERDAAARHPEEFPRAAAQPVRPAQGERGRRRRRGLHRNRPREPSGNAAVDGRGIAPAVFSE